MKKHKTHKILNAIDVMQHVHLFIFFQIKYTVTKTVGRISMVPYGYDFN